MYYLKNKHTQEQTLVNIIKRVNGKLFKYSTGVKVQPKFWDLETKQILKGYPNYSKTNTFLNKLQTRFDTILWDLKAEERLTHENLRNRLDEIIGRVRLEEKSLDSFREVWELKWMESLKVDRAPSTIKKKGYTLKSLLHFEIDTGYKLTFESINDVFAENYKEWALQVKNENGKFRYSKDNAIHKNISITKEFMRWAKKRGYTEMDNFKLIEGYSEEYFAPFALTNNDVSVLMKLEFENLDMNDYNVRPCNQEKVKIALEKTRDAFVFRCLCGIRYSDYDQLTPKKLQNGQMSLVTQKTSTEIKLPLHNYAQKILEKYNFQVPKLHNQNENENLKLLAQVAGFNEAIIVYSKRAGRKVEESKKRWELVSTHTARKTFITNCLRAGVRDYVIMEIVGIKKMATFQRYIQVFNSDIQAAMKLQSEIYQ